PLAGSLAWSPLPAAITYEGHSAVYDPIRDRILVFGGARARLASECIGNPCDYYCYEADYPTNDVWALDLHNASTWVKLSTTGAAPQPRWEHAAVYDPVRNRMVVFGGQGGSRFGSAVYN